MLSCTNRFLTCETMVHHDKTSWCHTACVVFFRTIRSSQGREEKKKYTKCSLFKIYEVKFKLYTTAMYLALIQTRIQCDCIWSTNTPAPYYYKGKCIQENIHRRATRLIFNTTIVTIMCEKCEKSRNGTPR